MLPLHLIAAFTAFTTFTTFAAFIAFAAWAPAQLHVGVLAPGQVLHAHLPHDQAFGLGIGAFLGFLALFGGIENLHQVALGNQESGPRGTGPRYNLSSGILGVLAGSFFIWLTLIFIRPRVE